MEAEQPEAGLEVLQDCLKRQRPQFGSTDDRTLATFARLLDALSELERYEEAIALSQFLQQELEGQGRSRSAGPAQQPGAAARAARLPRGR